MSGYTWDGKPESDGILDPVDPDLPGRIDLRRLNPPESCPLGQAKRLLMDPSALRSFLEKNRPKMAYVATPRKHDLHQRLALLTRGYPPD